MAKTVDEIMNKELFNLRASEPAEDAVGFLLALGITGAPVLDENGRPVGVLSLRDGVHAAPAETVSARMTAPAATVFSGARIEDAARDLAESGRHRLVVVDGDGRAVGMLSALDVVRGLLGLPAVHPAAFPHFDRRTGVSWTDDAVLELDRVSVAPDGPGVLALVHGASGVPERVVWVESCSNVRARLYEILSLPQDDALLARTLRLGGLRFRAATITDPAARKRVLEAAQAQALAVLRPAARGAA